MGDVEEGMTSGQWPVVNNDMTLLRPNGGKGIHRLRHTKNHKPKRTNNEGQWPSLSLSLLG